jgi:antitoxin MazE
MAAKTRIIRIGNSQFLRVPKALLEQAQLPAEVELYAEPGRLIVRDVRRPRAGWAAAAKAARVKGADRLLDQATATRFDEKGWQW